MWHPAKQREYKVDALILLHISFEILSTRVLEILFKEGNYEEFLRIEVKTADGKKNTMDIMVGSPIKRHLWRYQTWDCGI